MGAESSQKRRPAAALALVPVDGRAALRAAPARFLLVQPRFQADLLLPPDVVQHVQVVLHAVIAEARDDAAGVILALVAEAHAIRAPRQATLEAALPAPVGEHIGVAALTPQFLRCDVPVLGHALYGLRVALLPQVVERAGAAVQSADGGELPSVLLCRHSSSFAPVWRLMLRLGTRRGDPFPQCFSAIPPTMGRGAIPFDAG